MYPLLEIGLMLVVDRIENELRGRMTQMRNKVKEQFPHEQELARMHGVSRKTIRRAMERLKRERLVHSVRGKGTFISKVGAAKMNVLVIFSSPYQPYDTAGVGVVSSLLKSRRQAPNLMISKDPGEEWESLGVDRDRIGGIVLLGSYTRETVRRVVDQAGVPVVYIGDLAETVRGLPIFDQVLPDNRGLAHRAAEWLIQQGHRGIMLLGWGFSKAWGQDAVQGYREALEMHGLKFDERWIMDFPRAPFGGARGGKEVLPEIGLMQRRIDDCLGSKDPPTALIHYSGSEAQIRDIVHYQFHDHFKPESIVAVSFEEILHREYKGFGEMTAVCMKLEKLAGRAIELLMRPREEGEAAVREFLEETYVLSRKDGIWERVRDGER
jgi:DNA-binding LacI/PurR family transcriptional regulator